MGKSAPATPSSVEFGRRETTQRQLTTPSDYPPQVATQMGRKGRSPKWRFTLTGPTSIRKLSHRIHVRREQGPGVLERLTTFEQVAHAAQPLDQVTHESLDPRRAAPVALGEHP